MFVASRLTSNYRFDKAILNPVSKAFKWKHFINILLMVELWQSYDSNECLNGITTGFL